MSRNVFLHILGLTARKFRIWQEVWILPWWDNGGLTSVPLWAVDALVLLVKLCSTCAVSTVRIFVPPIMKSLHGETVLITGTEHGVCRELALQLADLGANIVCWDNEPRRNKSLVNEILSKGGECICYNIDVTAKDQIISLASRMQRQVTDVSMVITSPGWMSCSPLSNLSVDTATRLLETNLLPHLWIIQAFLPSMIERRQGHIVAINSSAGLMPCGDMAPYCAAKFGLRGLMESITEELRLDTWTKNINITSVYLGTVTAELYPTGGHRFNSWVKEVTSKDAARIIIEGIRKNHREISIPCYMKSLINLNNLMPYRIRIIFSDFFNVGHRGWFCFC